MQENAAGWHGEASLPDKATLGKLNDPPPDPSGELAASAAAVFHAGVMAELIDAGHPWTGPIFYPEASDFLQANDMLRQAFGNNCSGAHAYSQQVALHVLSNRWPEVEEIAAELLRSGEWRATAEKVLP